MIDICCGEAHFFAKVFIKVENIITKFAKRVNHSVD